VAVRSLARDARADHPRTPYIVPYRIKGNLVEILRVFHGARRWPDEPVG